MDDSATMPSEIPASALPLQQRSTRRLECPRCHQQTGLLGAESPSGERGELPEGLGSVTSVQCQKPECLFEWEAVTRGQVLRSMRNWQGRVTF